MHSALVLGGSSGLGRASARAIAASGSRVIITSRDQAKADAVARELGENVTGLALDLSDPAALDVALPRFQEAWIDQLILNSGGPAPSRAVDIEVDTLRTALETLLFAHVRITRALLPAMLAGGWGRIVAIASSGVQSPLPQLVASNVGRGALAAYLKSLAGDVAKQGVTVNMVLPGTIDTDRVTSLDRTIAEQTGRDAQTVRAESTAGIPVGRYGEPDEFGAAVAFLASDAASYITGEQLRVDGGASKAY